MAQLAQFTTGTAAGSPANEPVTFTADNVDYDRDNVAGDRHRPCRGVAERPRAARRPSHLRPQHRRRRGHRPCGAAGAGRAGAVRRLRRTDAGHAATACCSGMRALLAAERQAGGQRRAAHRRRRSTSCRRSSIPPAISASKDPTRPPLWQIRACIGGAGRSSTRRSSTTTPRCEMYGIPVVYFPYFWTADPSVKRASGLLIPELRHQLAISAPSSRSPITG